MIEDAARLVETLTRIANLPERELQDLAKAESLARQAAQSAVLGHLDVAAKQAERSLLLRHSHLGAEHLEVAMGLSRLGTIRTEQGHYRSADSLLDSALRIGSWTQIWSRSAPARPASV
jgi:hypothetical protein